MGFKWTSLEPSGKGNTVHTLAFNCYAGIKVMKLQLKQCLSRKYQNFLSSDWLPLEDAQYFSLREFYLPIVLEEKTPIPGGVKLNPVVSLYSLIEELTNERTKNASLLVEGKFLQIS